MMMIPTRIYLCGQFDRITDGHIQAMNKETERLRELGYHVENPMEWEDLRYTRREERARVVLSKLLSCDTLAWMPGAMEDEQATFEFYVADRCGIQRMPVHKIVGAINRYEESSETLHLWWWIAAVSFAAAFTWLVSMIK